MELLSRHIICPYCGENIELLIDDSATYHMSMDGRYVARSQEGGAIMSMEGGYRTTQEQLSRTIMKIVLFVVDRFEFS